jgi:hypothetical protein
MGKAKELAELANNLTVSGGAVTVSGFNYDNIVDSAPGALNTLNELAAALGDDANFSTNVTSSIGNKLSLTGGTLTGKLEVVTTGNDVTADFQGANGKVKATRYGHLSLQNTDNSTTESFALSLRSAGGMDISYGTPNASHSINTSGSIMRFSNDFKVGIGTTSPQVKLQVNDTGTAVPTSGYGTGFNVSRADGLIGMTMGYLTTNNTMYIQARNFTNTDSQPLLLNPNGGNVGIGATSPSDQIAGAANLVIGTTSDADSGMTFVSTTSGQSLIHFSDANSGNARYDGFIGYEQNNQAMKFGTAQTERMRIDSSGRVGIGITPAAVSDSTGADSLQLGGSFLVHFDEDGSGTTSLSNNLYWNGSNNKALFYGYTSQYYQTGGTHIWRNSGITGAGSNATLTELMRIDSSGKLLVGKTASNYATEGVEIRSNEILITKGGTNPLSVRNNGDGGIISLNSAGTTVGTIGVRSGTSLYVGSDASNRTGLDFSGAILPRYAGSLNSANNVDIGAASYRFKDLYLSGGIDFGNASSIDTGGESNLLNDYETGTWTPKLKDINGNEASAYQSGYPKGTYTKIGRHVWVNFSIRITNKGSMSGNYVFVANLPFNKDSTAEGRGTGSIDYYSGLSTTKSYLALDTTSTVSVFWLVGGTNATGSHYVTVANLNNSCMFKGGGNYIAT